LTLPRARMPRRSAARVAREFAPAKINLYLHITGQRADGYHTLDSLIAFANIGDVIEARAADELSLRIVGPNAGALHAAAADNLALRAARALRDRCVVTRGARLTLRKNLPVAAGIGGGSADAAATLRALIRLWRIKPAERVLASLALSLGADVPACLRGRAVFAGGIGERLAAAPSLPSAAIVLINPGIGLPTPHVFAARQGPFSTAQRFRAAPRDFRALAALIAERRNDLTDAAVQLCPPVAEILARLAEASGCLVARMSGSGATCYGIFDGSAAAARAARRIGVEHPDWWIRSGRLC